MIKMHNIYPWVCLMNHIFTRRVHERRVHKVKFKRYGDKIIESEPIQKMPKVESFLEEAS